LRIDLADWSRETAYAEYDDFKITGSEDKYRLTSLGTFKGTKGDAMLVHKGDQFTTYDQKNDKLGLAENCARTCMGGWWYEACQHANLNGLYSSTAVFKGINWYWWKGHSYSLASTSMKIRPWNF